MRVAIHLPVHGRGKITTDTLKNLQYPRSLGWEIIAFGSGLTKAQQQLCDAYHLVANRPLGAKLNKGMEIIKQGDYDYVFCTGEDNLYNQEIIKHYHYLMLEYKYHIIGLLDLYYYNSETKEEGYFKGYKMDKQGKTLGAGRCLHWNLLESLDFEPWDSKKNRALDASMDAKLYGREYQTHAFSMQNSPFIAVDVKDKNNINSWDLIKNQLQPKQGIYGKIG